MLNCKEELNKINQLLLEYKKAVDVSSILSKTDPEGNITYVNSKFCEISGYDENELIGKKHNIVRHPNMPKAIFKELWNSIKNKKIWNGIFQNLKKDGSSYWVDATIIPILNKSNEVVEIIGIRHDISEIIKKEQELEKLRIEQMKNSLSEALKFNLNKIVESIPVPSIIIEEDFKILSFNSEFYNLFNIIQDGQTLEKLKKLELNFKAISNISEFSDFELNNLEESYYIDLINEDNFKIKIKAVNREVGKYLILFIKDKD